MSLRKIKLPDDIDLIAESSIESFVYPENPEWSLRQDEIDEIVSQINTIKKWWPLIAMLGVFLRSVRDLMMGYIWEVDGEAAGTILFQRKPTGDYYINNVSVLPNFRRQGIARKMVNAAIEEIKKEGGKMIKLDVIEGNLPAYKLYEDLGFVTYSGTAVMDLESGVLPPETPLPGGFARMETKLKDWQLNYNFVCRVTPTEVQNFNPVREADYRPRRVMTVLERITGGKWYQERVLLESCGKMCGRVAAGYRAREGGLNHARLQIDPQYPELTAWMVSAHARKIAKLAPGRRLEIHINTWQEEMIQAALDAGLSKRQVYLEMGLKL